MFPAVVAGIKKHAAVAVVVALWIPLVAIGLNILLKYSNTPGNPGTPPVKWPPRAALQQDGKRATLLMFVHPQCPCSRASIGELARIMAHAGGTLDARVYFYFPAPERPDWARTDLWISASTTPGVRVLEDRDAVAARAFGAATSGETLLYGSDGRLIFEGGITASRGHSGDNAGRAVIESALQGQLPANNTWPVKTPVFGCSLLDARMEADRSSNSVRQLGLIGG